MTNKKNIVFLFILGITITAQAQVKKKIKYYELDVIRGLFFQPNTKDPYTGMAYDEHSNGKKKLEAPIRNGKLHGTVKEWARNGQKVYETDYENGVQMNKETQWYESGGKSLEVTYRNGKPDGACTEWHENGSKKSQGLFRNGIEEGFHQWWFDQGEKDQEATFSNGKMIGPTRNWYRDGQLKLETNYKDGLRHGTVKEYFRNGQIKMEGVFHEDKEDKEHLFWSSKGVLLGKQIYDKGDLLQEFNYRSGNIKTQRGYIQVFNQKESFYKVTVDGTTVNEIKDPINIAFAVDGMLLQMYDVPIHKVNTEETTPSKILDAFVRQEAKWIAEEEQFTIEPAQQAATNANGIPYIYWSFKSPRTADAEQKPRTPQTEHYISLLCNKQILNLYSVVTPSDEAPAVEAMLKRIADQVVLEKERMDLNEIAKSVY